MGLLGTSFFASAITAMARSSFKGLSITVIYVGYSTTTLWCEPPPSRRRAAAIRHQAFAFGPFTAMGKFKVTGTIGSQNMVTKTETGIPNPVLGDMVVETDYENSLTRSHQRRNEHGVDNYGRVAFDQPERSDASGKKIFSQ